MELGVANSIYTKEGYDHLKTIKWAKENDVSFVQAYLNDSNLKDSFLLGRIYESSRDDRRLITHIHKLPEKYSFDKCTELLNSHTNVLFADTISVVHYDSEKEAIINCYANLFNNITKTGRLYVENFHKGITDKDELIKCMNWKKFILDNNETIAPLGAVIDYPRYFVNETNSERVVRTLIDDYTALTKRYTPIFFHTIGAKDFRQRREDFCAPGSKEDIIPHKEILQEFHKISNLDNSKFLILECEEIEHAEQGVHNLREILDIL